jgi:hypothetical protein
MLRVQDGQYMLDVRQINYKSFFATALFLAIQCSFLRH